MTDILIIIAAAVFIVTLFLRLKVSSIIGYFATGAIIGKHGLGWVQSHTMMDSFGEFGIVFLLFLIGLELTFERLIAMRAHVFGFGTLQLITTMLLVGSICTMLDLSLKASAIIGGALALSSTAIVLQVLKDYNKEATQVGRLSVAILILQDFAVAPLLVFVQLASTDSGLEVSFLTSMMQALVKTFVALVIIFITGRVLLRPIFNAIAHTKSNELFLATTLLIILAASYITEKFELSMALGAFVAGLLVAETEYRHEVEQVILPFKGLLLGLFFLTVGMSIDFKLLLQEFDTVLLLSSSLILLKSSVIFFLCRLFTFKTLSSLQAGLLLSQGGEFAFILFGLEGSKELLGEYISQILMMVVTCTMAITPLLHALGMKVESFIQKKQKGNMIEVEKDSADINDMNHHVIIGGFGKVGKTVAQFLSLEKINYVAIDADLTNVEKAQKDGIPVYLGDISRIKTLKFIGIERAKIVVLATSNAETVKRTIKVLASNFPNICIIARTYDLSDVQHYKDLGAHFLIPQVSETGIQLGGAALLAIGFNHSAIISLKNNFRDSIYKKKK